jgi:hypothetical protein
LGAGLTQKIPVSMKLAISAGIMISSNAGHQHQRLVDGDITIHQAASSASRSGSTTACGIPRDAASTAWCSTASRAWSTVPTSVDRDGEA